jgi:hypothetical protein
LHFNYFRRLSLPWPVQAQAATERLINRKKETQTGKKETEQTQTDKKETEQTHTDKKETEQTHTAT